MGQEDQGWGRGTRGAAEGPVVETVAGQGGDRWDSGTRDGTEGLGVGH